MKKTFLCMVLFLLGFNYTLQAQGRIVAPDAKEWIKNNQEKIKIMTRAEWQELNEGYKWIVFNELSAQQRHEFFRLKIEQVRDNFEWSKEERKHIDALHTFFVNTPNLYGEESEEIRASNEKFITDWVRQAMEELKWPQKLIQGIVMDCNDLLDKEGNVCVTSS